MRRTEILELLQDNSLPFAPDTLQRKRGWKRKEGVGNTREGETRRFPQVFRCMCLRCMLSSRPAYTANWDLVSRRKKGKEGERKGEGERRKERRKGGREEDFKIPYAGSGRAFQV